MKKWKKMILGYMFVGSILFVGCSKESGNTVGDKENITEFVFAGNEDKFEEANQTEEGRYICDESMEEKVEFLTEETAEVLGEEIVEGKGNEIGMENVEDTAENLGKEYTVNKDGTYTYNGKIFKYKVAVTGRGAGAVCDVRYILLTNHAEISYEDVENSMLQSTTAAGPFYEVVFLGIEVMEDK